MSNLPTPPLEETLKSHQVRKSTKQSKPISRTSKRASTSHEHGAVVIDGRHKRVWKACERCRMKKTKCDGESPCKRCKDDGLVCTAGSRKKTEFKQLPRGYAEVLENTQYALIATVQKLYTMVRNNETWELGEPEMNDRGQPVIHDIASKLGCIRASPDLPHAFPEGSEDFAELQAQLQAARSEMGSEDTFKAEGSLHSSPSLARTERASSSESDHSNLSKEYNSMMWSQQQQAAKKTVPSSVQKQTRNTSTSTSLVEDESTYSARTSFDNTASIPSPIYTDFHADSPMIRNDSPFTPWSANDDFLGQSNGLDITAHYMRQNQYQNFSTSSPLNSSNPLQPTGMGMDVLKAMQLADGLNFAEGTIRPNMLDCNTGYDMDSVMFNGDYELQMRMA